MKTPLIFSSINLFSRVCSLSPKSPGVLCTLGAMQSSLKAFVVRGATAAQHRQLREKAAIEAEAKKASEAARIGLAWPRCGRRRVGDLPGRIDGCCRSLGWKAAGHKLYLRGGGG